MRQTRLEIIKELSSVLGHSEETEHVIDWVQEVWETYDFLVKRVGREHAHQIMNAIDVCPDVFPQDDLTLYRHTHEQMNQCLLN
jgi:hypothetical protein